MMSNPGLLHNSGRVQWDIPIPFLLTLSESMSLLDACRRHCIHTSPSAYRCHRGLIPALFIPFTIFQTDFMLLDASVPRNMYATPRPLLADNRINQGCVIP